MQSTPFLFGQTLAGWNSWEAVFQSIPAFTPLAQAVFRQHGLPFAGLAPLTPGTNAVFRSGAYVIKIYAPAETGIPPDTAELEGLRHAQAAGVPCPQVVAQGVMQDKYCFFYLITSLVPGCEAGDVLPGWPAEKRAQFARSLHGCVQKLNTPYTGTGIPHTVVANVLENDRWKPFPAALHKEICSFAKSLPQENWVFVHGDLTGENVLVDANGQFSIIDFGDCHLAPASYEWPPLVFELLRCDAVMMAAYFGNYRHSSFVKTLTQAVVLHDFGGNIIADLCKRRQISKASIGSIAALGQLIETSLQPRFVQACDTPK